MYRCIVGYLLRNKRVKSNTNSDDSQTSHTCISLLLSHDDEKNYINENVKLFLKLKKNSYRIL